MKDLIRRCCICGTIEVDGRLIPKSQYSVDKLAGQGKEFTDGFLSKQCIVRQYGNFGRKFVNEPENSGLRDSCL